MKYNKEITIYDIAKALNISASTVSRGLKDHPHLRKETKNKIRAKAKEFGYRQNKFASNLRMKHTNTLGVIVPRLNSYFMSNVLSGMENITNQNGYHLIICQSLESVKNEKAAVSTLFNSCIDGLLVSLSYDTKNLDHFNIFHKKNIPIVFFDRVGEQSNSIIVIIDNFKAAYEATTHLIEQGCKRIMHIGGSLIRNVYNDRFKGYKQALADNNIRFNPKLVCISELNDQAGIETINRMKELDKSPDGIFSANDVSAVAIISELKRAGIRIPEDISVVGFNNDPISSVVEPNLTTINYPGKEMGEIAASTMINKLNNSLLSNVNAIVLEHSLIIRQSSVFKKNE
jgi:LacI family transcriptional regulator